MSSLEALTGTGVYASELGGVAAGPAGFVEATVATTPAAVDDEVMVLVGAEGSQLQAGPCRWEPRLDGQPWPKRGDPCLVVTGDRGHRAIAWWAPTTPSLPRAGDLFVPAAVARATLASNTAFGTTANAIALSLPFTPLAGVPVRISAQIHHFKQLAGSQQLFMDARIDGTVIETWGNNEVAGGGTPQFGHGVFAYEWVGTLSPGGPKAIQVAGWSSAAGAYVTLGVSSLVVHELH